jgi:putative phosphoesterase
VRGNCDIGFEGYSFEESVTFEGVRILLCHGHQYGVKGGIGALLSSAIRDGYRIALFGHTHIPFESYDAQSGVYLFNPGSIGKRDAGAYSFGVITLKNNAVLLSHGKVQSA